MYKVLRVKYVIRILICLLIGSFLWTGCGSSNPAAHRAPVHGWRKNDHANIPSSYHYNAGKDVAF
jgi:hypothetical protein